MGIPHRVDKVGGVSGTKQNAGCGKTRSFKSVQHNELH